MSVSPHPVRGVLKPITSGPVGQGPGLSLGRRRDAHAPQCVYEDNPGFRRIDDLVHVPHLAGNRAGSQAGRVRRPVPTILLGAQNAHCKGKRAQQGPGGSRDAEAMIEALALPGPGASCLRPRRKDDQNAHGHLPELGSDASSLVSQGLDGVEAGRLSGGEIAEHDTHGRAEEQS